MPANQKNVSHKASFLLRWRLNAFSVQIRKTKSAEREESTEMRELTYYAWNKILNYKQEQKNKDMILVFLTIYYM